MIDGTTTHKEVGSIQGLTVTHRIQKPFSNVLITALAKDNNRCQVQIMYKNAKPNALFQAPCDIWFK